MCLLHSALLPKRMESEIRVTLYLPPPQPFQLQLPSALPASMFWQVQRTKKKLTHSHPHSSVTSTPPPPSLPNHCPHQLHPPLTPCSLFCNSNAKYRWRAYIWHKHCPKLTPLQSIAEGIHLAQTLPKTNSNAKYSWRAYIWHKHCPKLTPMQSIAEGHTSGTNTAQN